jgi:hypothetical protein
VASSGPFPRPLSITRCRGRRRATSINIFLCMDACQVPSCAPATWLASPGCAAGAPQSTRRQQPSDRHGARRVASAAPLARDAQDSPRHRRFAAAPSRDPGGASRQGSRYLAARVARGQREPSQSASEPQVPPHARETLTGIRERCGRCLPASPRPSSGVEPLSRHGAHRAFRPRTRQNEDAPD